MTGTDLINTEALRQLIREELRAMQAEGSKPAEGKDGDEELSIKQVAEMKGVRPRTVYDWVREGRIPFHRTPGAVCASTVDTPSGCCQNHSALEAFRRQKGKTDALPEKVQV